MKVLESERRRNDALAGSSAAAEKNVDLKKYRKKKKHGRLLVKLVIVLLLLIAGIIVWVNAETIFEPLRGIASRIETKTSYSAGFPIELPGSSQFSLKKMGENFSLLTDTYLYAYDTSGAQMYALKHGYSNPRQVTNDKRVLLYDKSGNNFAVYSRSSLMFEKTTDDKIVYTAVGNDNLYAVVTESDRYANGLYIYDDGGNWKYTRKFADENIMQVCFVGDGESITVSTLSSSQGDIVTGFYKFSIKSTDNSIWKYSMSTNSLPCGMYSDKEKVIAVCDNSVISLSCEDGTLLGNYSYTGDLRHFDITADSTVLHYNDISTNKNMLVVLDSNSDPVSAVTTGAGTSCLCVDGSGIYVMDGIHFRAFDKELLNEKEAALANEGYTEFIKIGDSIFLLGYNTINKVVIAFK